MLHKGYNYIYINEYKNRGAYTAILAASLKVRQYRLLQGFYLLYLEDSSSQSDFAVLD